MAKNSPKEYIWNQYNISLGKSNISIPSYKVAIKVSQIKGVIGSLKRKTLFLKNNIPKGSIPEKRAVYNKIEYKIKVLSKHCFLDNE